MGDRRWATVDGRKSRERDATLDLDMDTDTADGYDLLTTMMTTAATS